MIHIQDAVVGHIEPTETELALIEDENMQRLRYIKQIGLGSLVYPGANHTRFEHSLGTMHITRQMIEQISDKKIEELECVGLLHDIGHAAFSHNSDFLLEKYLKMTHEQAGAEIIKKSSIKDVIQDSTLSMNKLIDFFNGKGLGEIVTGSLGSDRIDYLARDSHYTGVAYGVIDYQNIKDRLVLYKGKPAVYEQGAGSVESLLIARYSMFRSVYHHHTVLIAEGMYTKAVENAIRSGKLDKHDLKNLSDWDMLTRLREIKDSKELTNRIINRKLYKRAYFDHISDKLNVEEINDAIERTGLGHNEYIVSTRRFNGSGVDVPIVNRNGKLMGKLPELSPLVKTLTSTIEKRRILVASCETKNIPKVKAAVEKAL